MDVDAILYYIPVAVSVLITTIYSIIGFNTNLGTKRLIIQILIINLEIFLLGSLFWRYIANEGFSMVFGWLLYGGIFVGVEIVSSAILYFIKK